MEAGLSTWATEWIRPQELEAALEQLPRFKTVWVRGLEFDRSKGAFVPLLPLPRELSRVQEALVQAKSCRGTFIQNTGASGFDPGLGTRIVGMSEEAVRTLAERLVQDGVSAFQVDLESLPESAAADYERFLDRLIASLRGRNVRLSIALHARGDAPAADYEGARFQRWSELAKRPELDFVLMAYDHHWSTSAPGAIAPLDWVERVVRKALKTFSPERLIVALPLYGYHWKKAAGRWQGKPALAPELAERAQGRAWSARPPAPADGEIHWKGQNEAIAFDGETAAGLKTEALKKLGLTRFALWRLGGSVIK